MNWFRKHVKSGSRLALLALAVQFALSFGHFHTDVVRLAPTIQSGLAAADRTNATPLAEQGAQPEAAQPSSNHDTDRHLTDCAICAVLSLANNFLSATPPLLALPQANELRHLTTGTEFAHLGPLHSAFRSRAPPVS